MRWQPKAGCTPPVPLHGKDWTVQISKLSLYVFKSSPSDPGTVYERKLPRVDCGRSRRRGRPVFLNRDWSHRAVWEGEGR